MNKQSLKGLKDANEDRIRVAELSPNVLFIGVFDGHGGSFVVDFVNNHLHEYVKRFLKQGTSSLTSALRRGFIDCDLALARAMDAGKSHVIFEEVHGRITWPKYGIPISLRKYLPKESLILNTNLVFTLVFTIYLFVFFYIYYVLRLDGGLGGGTYDKSSQQDLLLLYVILVSVSCFNKIWRLMSRSFDSKGFNSHEACMLWWCQECYGNMVGISTGIFQEQWYLMLQ